MLCLICENITHYFFGRNENQTNISGAFQEKVILCFLLFWFHIRMESIEKAMAFACSGLACNEGLYQSPTYEIKT